MSVKIGSSVISGVFVGESGGGKTNVDKIVIGNADGTGTVVWPSSSPTVGGSWDGWVFDEYVYESEYNGQSYWTIVAGSNNHGLYFHSGGWYVDDVLIQNGTGSETYISSSSRGVYLQWHE